MESSSRDKNINIKIIKLVSNFSSLGIKESAWKNSLKKATPDKAVGIRHAEISGDSNYRLHVAAIPNQVTCHYHTKGDEDYSILAGKGVQFFGKVTDGVVKPEDWKKVEVKTGDSYVIPEGYAHQLKNSGSEDLIILFGCPDSHLNDDEDRTVIVDTFGL